MTRILLIAGVVLAAAVSAQADEKLKDIACRSVHLGYTAAAGTAFYLECTPEQTADGTYFCAIGFNGGYFGIQQQGKGQKVVICSVWDPARGDDPKKIEETQRVRCLHQGEQVRIGRFGGEGTGGQSFFNFDWKLNETYRFLVAATPDTESGRTTYSGYFYLPNEKTWKHLVTFSTLAKKSTLSGYYSFVEDFKRNRESTKLVRKATFGNAWVKPETGDWQAVTQARFTADSNPVLNIDAGLGAKKDRFWLATGGQTKNDSTKLKDTIKLADGVQGTPPADWTPNRAWTPPQP
jgi:hypothetical protein